MLNNYANVLAMLQQMRQACDHPFLVLSRSDANTDVARIGAILLQRWQGLGANESELDAKQVIIKYPHTSLAPNPDTPTPPHPTPTTPHILTSLRPLAS